MQWEVAETMFNNQGWFTGMTIGMNEFWKYVGANWVTAISMLCSPASITRLQQTQMAIQEPQAQVRLLQNVMELPSALQVLSPTQRFDYADSCQAPIHAIQPMKVPLREMEKRKKEIQRRQKRPPKTKQVQTDGKTIIEREEEAMALLEQIEVVVEGMTLDEVIELHEGSDDKAFRRALRIKIAMIHITGKSELDRKHEFENFLIKYAKLKDMSLKAWSGFVKALSEKANGVEHL